MNKVKTMDDSWYRIKDYENKLSSNISLTGGANSISVFSSMTDKDNFAVKTLFGFSGNGKNSIKSGNGSTFGNAFVGNKYYFVSADQKDTVDGLSYTKRIGDGEDTIKSGAFYLYENTLSFPLAYMVEQTEGLHFEHENTSANRQYNQRALFDYLNGESFSGASGGITNSMISSLQTKLALTNVEYSVGQGKIEAKAQGTDGQILMLCFIATKGYSVTVNGEKAELIKNDLNLLCVKLDDGENNVVFEYHSPYPKYCLFGLAVGVLVSLAILGLAFVLSKQNKFTKTVNCSIQYLAFAVGGVVVAFFFLYPIAVGIIKIGFCIFS